MSSQQQTQRFTLGQVVATPGVLEAFATTVQSAKEFLDRRAAGDWGDVSNEDKKENDDSVIEDLRILSAYHLRDGTKIWIITEADRSSTCVLLPEEY